MSETNNLCESYAVLVLCLTTSVTYIGKNWSFQQLAWVCMLIPGFTALWCTQDEHFVWNLLGYEKPRLSMTFAMVGCLFTIFILSFSIVFAQFLEWGKFDERPKRDDNKVLDIIPMSIRALGEEVGWRCYLLPCLVDKYGNIAGVLLCGLVWATYHTPIMLLLSKTWQNIQYPRSIIALQWLAIFMLNIVFCWAAIKSEFTIWAPVLMHLSWNRINPPMLGSIYTQTHGRMEGELWKVNGEGLTGCIVMTPLVAYLLFLLW